MRYRAKFPRVRRYTSQLCATFCIQVPISETICPPMKSRKLGAAGLEGVRDAPRKLRVQGEPDLPNCAVRPHPHLQNNARYNGGSIIRTFQEKSFGGRQIVSGRVRGQRHSRSASPSERRLKCVNRKLEPAPRFAQITCAPRPSRSAPSHFNSGAMKSRNWYCIDRDCGPPLRSSYGLHARSRCAQS